MKNKRATPRRILFLLASARKNGNTERLARRAASAFAITDEQIWMHLSDYPLPPFRDIRHDGGVYPEPQDNESTLAVATLWATDLVFCCPVYWYSLPAGAKLYLDYWSAWLRVASLDFKAQMAGKRLWAITTVSDDGDASAKPLIGTLKLTAEYMAMRWGGALIGHANRPDEILNDARALKAAVKFFKD